MIATRKPNAARTARNGMCAPQSGQCDQSQQPAAGGTEPASNIIEPCSLAEEEYLIKLHIQKISEMDEACYKRNKQRGNRIANKVCRHALLLVLMWTRLLVSYGDADSFVAFQWDSSYMAEKLNQEFHAKDPIQHPFSLVSACCIRDIPCRSFIFESGEDLSNFRAQNAKPPRKHRSVGLGKQAEDMTSPSVNSLSLC